MAVGAEEELVLAMREKEPRKHFRLALLLHRE
jgi:hypothetical protein